LSSGVAVLKGAMAAAPAAHLIIKQQLPMAHWSAVLSFIDPFDSPLAQLRFGSVQRSPRPPSRKPLLSCASIAVITHRLTFSFFEES
jgi:hypothetical protein